MKKKFLSLMMAAAVVATTSVSAFASTTNTVNGEEGGTYQQDVIITGDIEDDNGHTKPGTISVSVPTNASFMVSKEGTFTGSEIQLTNLGTTSVDVSAERFIDSNSAEGIELKSESEVTSNQTNVDRNKVALRLISGKNTIYLSSTGKASGNDTGLYKEKTITEKATDDEEKYLLTLNGTGSTGTISISGDAGQKAVSVSKPIKDTFTLTLKIKKSTK